MALPGRGKERNRVKVIFTLIYILFELIRILIKILSCEGMTARKKTDNIKCRRTDL